MSRRRTLTDSEARWEAVSLIAGVIEDAITVGYVTERAESEGWTDADCRLIESHAQERVNALIRRPRKFSQ